MEPWRQFKVVVGLPVIAVVQPAEDALELVGELDVVEPADGLDVRTESLLALVNPSSAQLTIVLNRADW